MPRLNYLKSFSLIVALLTLCCPGQAWAAATSIQVGIVHNNNVTNSWREHTGDSGMLASVDYSTLQVLNRNWQVGYGGSLQTSSWLEYPGLNLTELGVHGSLRRKFGLGPYVPRMDLRFELARQFSKVNEWSGNWVRGSVTVQKRFNPEWDVSLSGEYARLFARREVYATTNLTTTLRIDYDPNPNWRASVAMGYTDGDKLSWCRNSWPRFVGTPQWLDYIFDDDWFPYQAKGFGPIGSLTLARALNPDTTLAFTYEYVEERAATTHVYVKHTYGLQWIHNF